MDIDLPESAVKEDAHQSDMEEDDITHFKSLDKQMITKHLKASHIKVHVDNLIEPKESHKIRNLSIDHVASIATALKSSMTTYMTLIGLMSDDKINMEDLKTPGTATVEVLGGNHTRAALIKLREESPDIFNSDERYQFVYMDIYSNISNEQSLYLGYEHNVVHENSKEMSFQEKVVFFHKVLQNCRIKFNNLPDKTIHGKWRCELSAIIQISKRELNHRFKTHLALARCFGLTWNYIKDVFKQFNKGAIKSQKSNDNLTQYSFVKFTQLKTEEEKQSLLKRVATGGISMEEFKSLCAGESNASKKEQNHQKTCKSTKRSKKISQDEIIEELQELKNDLKKEKSEKTQLLEQLQNKNEELKKKGDLLEELQHEKQRLEKEYEEKIENLTAKLLKHKAYITSSKKREENLQLELEKEKARSEIAEEAAVRAREINERAKIDQPRPLIQKTIKRKKDSRADDNEYKVASSSRSNKKEKVEEILQPNDQEVDLAIVEYTQGKVYIGMMEDNILTYCHKPIGLIKDNTFLHQPTKMSFILNDRDKQTFDKSYVMVNIKGKLNGDKIKFDDLSLPIDQMLIHINNYITSDSQSIKKPTTVNVNIQ